MQSLQPSDRTENFYFYSAHWKLKIVLRVKKMRYNFKIDLRNFAFIKVSPFQFDICIGSLFVRYPWLSNLT